MGRFPLFAILIVLIWAAPRAHAGGGIISPGSFADPYSILSDSFVTPFVKTIGLTTDHRAYEPATPLGTRGLDLSIEATLAQVPGEFNAALTNAGSSGGSIPFFPVPRINLHKGLGEKADGGASLIFYQNFRILGFDLKVVLSQPEEGPTVALRMNYTTTKLTLPDTVTVDVSTTTYKPELLFSRQLDFADPYIGAGYAYATGDVTVTPPAPLSARSGTGRGGSFYAFTGVGMRLVPLGMKLTLEGTYNMLGVNAIGMKFGLNF